MGQDIQASEVHITAIEVKRSGFGKQLVENVDVVNLASSHMLPRRSSSVCSFTALLRRRNFPHGKSDRPKSMFVESRAYTVSDSSTPKGSSR